MPTSVGSGGNCPGSNFGGAADGRLFLGIHEGGVVPGGEDFGGGARLRDRGQQLFDVRGLGRDRDRPAVEQPSRVRFAGRGGLAELQDGRADGQVDGVDRGSFGFGEQVLVAEFAGVADGRFKRIEPVVGELHHAAVAVEFAVDLGGHGRLAVLEDRAAEGQRFRAVLAHERDPTRVWIVGGEAVLGEVFGFFEVVVGGRGLQRRQAVQERPQAGEGSWACLGGAVAGFLHVSVARGCGEGPSASGAGCLGETELLWAEADGQCGRLGGGITQVGSERLLEAEIGEPLAELPRFAVRLGRGVPENAGQIQPVDGERQFRRRRGGGESDRPIAERAQTQVQRRALVAGLQRDAVSRLIQTVDGEAAGEFRIGHRFGAEQVGQDRRDHAVVHLARERLLELPLAGGILAERQLLVAARGGAGDFDAVDVFLADAGLGEHRHGGRRTHFTRFIQIQNRN